MSDRDEKQRAEIVRALETQKQEKGRRAIYKVQSDEHRGELLATDLERKATGLKQVIKRDKVHWDDLAEVQQRCIGYLEDCGRAQAIPTVSGLSVFGLGVSRQALNLYMRNNPESRTTAFLEMVKDCLEDTLETAALNRNVDSVMAIFTMKNDHNRADRVQIEPVTSNDPLGEKVDAAALEARLSDIVVDDLEDADE